MERNKAVEQVRGSSKLIRRIIICFSLALLFICLLGLTFVSPSNEKKRVPNGLSNVIAKEVTLSKWENKERETIYNWGHDDVLKPLNATDFRGFAVRLRKFTKMLKDYEEMFGSDLPEGLYLSSKFLADFETALFPWIHYHFSSILHLKHSFNGPGIVIPTGSHHLKYAVFLVRSLRHLGCTLPICVAYAGPSDLKPEEVLYLNGLKVFTFDVSKYVDDKTMTLTGWEVKPFAMLFAPFSEVILMDADTVILRNPEELLTAPQYLKHHAIIFRDRTLFDKDEKKPRWLHANLPEPLSAQVLASRMYRQISAHEQESGIVIINKEHHLMGLLASCKLNCKEERDQVFYKEFYGDKESYWLGMEMAGETYGLLWEAAGVIGQETRSKKIKGNKKGDPVACGRILHFDGEGQPLWFNGGIVEDKRDEEKRKYLVDFTHYAHEGKWEFEKSCILESPSIPLNATTKALLQELGKLWRPSINIVDIRSPMPA